MILYLLALSELLVNRGAYGNELLDKFSNPLMVEGNEVGFSTNMWIMDSRIYSLYAGRGSFTFYLSYYDLGSFTYQSSDPNDSSWLTFSPYSMYGALAWRFKPDRNVDMSVRIGYYENRIMDDRVSAPFLDFDVRTSFKRLEAVAYLHNLNPLTFVKGGQLPLPYSLGAGILYSRGKWQISAGLRKIRGRAVEKYATLNYSFNPHLKAGFTLEPDYSYSRISLHMKASKGPLSLAYRVMVPSVQSDLIHVVTLEYNYASTGF